MNNKPAKPKKPAKPGPLRAAAEAQLAHAPKPKPKPKPKPYPTEKLLHELQVHQIELEMQNEQLRQAQIALEESRDRYVDLYEFAPVGYLTLTDTGIIGEINLTGAKLLGMERKKLLRRRFSTFVAPEYRERWNSLFTRVLRQDEADSCELAINSGDEKRLYTQLNCKRREKEGAAPVVRITLTDLTERKQTEEALKAARGQLQATLDAMPDLLFEVDAEGRIFSYHAHRSNLLAVTPEVFMGKRIADVLPPDVASVCQHAIDEAAQNGFSRGLTYRLDMPQGECWYELSMASMDAAAQPDQRFIMICRDITERKQAQDRQELLFAKTLMYAKEVEDLYSYAPCGYHSLDKDGTICLMNDTELSWLGYTRDEVIGKMKWPDLLTRAGAQRFGEDFPQLIKQGFVRNIEVEIIRKDGTTFNGLINATAIYDPRGNFLMSRSTVTDITARKQMERQLHNLHAHLQIVREEEKASIAREIHDDLGGTLTALKMESYRLAEELPADEKAAPLLDHIETMAKLIDYAVHVTRRVITGLRPTILDDFGLLAAIEWYAAQFSKRTGIECRVNCVAGEGCENELDRIRSINLFRIFQEALTNVMRHSSASRVAVEFHRDDGEILLSISDNGRGMKEKCADDPMHYGILGMTERVDQLGGKIEFVSPPGGGLRVEVYLPLPADNTKNGGTKEGKR